MQKSNLFIKLALLFLTITAVSSTNIYEEENVLVLTEDNFESALEANKYILVEFYAPWCGHCKSLAPEYASAATILKEKESPIKLAKVDATSEKTISEKYQIEGFPTLKFFINGNPIEYNGPRVADGIVSWVEKKSGPAYSVITELETLNSNINNNKFSCVFFGQEDNSRFAIFKEASETIDLINFYIFNNTNKFSEFSVQDGDIVLFKDFDEKKNILSKEQELTNEVLMEFIENSIIPLVSPFDENSADFIFGKNKVGLFLYRNPNQHSDLDDILRQIAPEYKGRITFIANGISGELEEKLAEFIGVTEEDLPAVKIHDVKDNEVKKYSLKKDITAENIKVFIEEFLAGKLNPEYKSEDIPETQDKTNNVVKIVGKNWESIVKDSTKDVLVMFYAPWCGHCQRLHPIFDNFANTLKDYDNLVFGRIDATLNEIEGEPIEHYPTIRFYSHSDKTSAEIEARYEFELLEAIKGKKLVKPIGDEIVFEIPSGEEDMGNEEGIEGLEGLEGLDGYEGLEEDDLEDASKDDL